MKISQGPKTLLYPTPVLVVGTYDAAGKPNIATAAWGGICCSRPPALQVSFRKATYTHGNITRSGVFTVSIPSEAHVQQADYAGLASGRDADKFTVAGLTPVRASLIDAPYVGEFPMVLECRLIHTLEVGLHTLFVGEILDVKVEESALDENGKTSIRHVAPLIFAPEDSAYFGVGERLAPAFSVGKALK
jgi:flavin reductase (DIM6/NTAB) family NADH-FMN oxidoreductase RutF